MIFPTQLVQLRSYIMFLGPVGAYPDPESVVRGPWSPLVVSPRGSPEIAVAGLCRRGCNILIYSGQFKAYFRHFRVLGGAGGSFFKGGPLRGVTVQLLRPPLLPPTSYLLPPTPSNWIIGWGRGMQNVGRGGGLRSG